MCGTRILAVIVVLAVAVVTVPAMADVTITYMGKSPSGWYLKSDPAVTVVDNKWPSGEKKHFHEEPGGPQDIRPTSFAQADPCVDCTGDRPVRWRLELGTLEGINWGQVMVQLKDEYGVEIGKNQCCRVVGWVKPIPGYSCNVEIYSRYTREFYHVEQGTDQWVVSVLTPCQGVCKVYTDVIFVGFASSGAMSVYAPPPPVSDLGTCGSMGSVPLVGELCDPGSGPSDGKDNFKIEPTNGNVEKATMGKVKSLYENK